ncbi:hypothetical protein ACFYYH_07675 [Streptomyces sp. NPDC002018]|uniref:hypothetical protein n=1 Tax=Streptomyces sp. NPDC002018 TaxID=3364629 RepID=UPI003683DDEB
MTLRTLDAGTAGEPMALRADVPTRPRHRADRMPLPLPGVGAAAGTAGTTIDTRPCLAFTTAVTGNGTRMHDT